MKILQIQKKTAYEAYQLLLCDVYNNGITKAKVIAENVSSISKVTGMDISKVRSAYEVVQNDVNQLSFGVGERNKVGYALKP